VNFRLDWIFSFCIIIRNKDWKQYIFTYDILPFPIPNSCARHLSWHWLQNIKNEVSRSAGREVIIWALFQRIWRNSINISVYTHKRVSSIRYANTGRVNMRVIKIPGRHNPTDPHKNHLDHREQQRY
jgi:hypothetical protein